MILRTGQSVLGATWSTAVVSFAGQAVFSRAVRDAVRDQVDKFINAFLSVNPKP